MAEPNASSPQAIEVFFSYAIWSKYPNALNYWPFMECQGR
jgi:hypothetical protein